MTFPKASGFSALISVFEFFPSVVHTFCLWFSLVFSLISFLKTLNFWGGFGKELHFPKPEPGAPPYLFYFLGEGERRGDYLNLAFYFLLLIPFSQSKKPRTAHLGTREPGLWECGRVEGKFQATFCVKRVEVVGILEEGILLVLAVAFFFF